MLVSGTVPRWRLRPVLTVLSMALGVWLGNSTPAQATCGDYLDHPANSVAAEHHPADFQPERSGPPRCNGPDCRNAPESPGLPVPPAPPTFAGEHWAWLGHPAPVPPRSAGRLIPDDDLLLPGGDPPALDRPPRSLRLVAPAIEA
jgi:hypothetical protein